MKRTVRFFAPCVSAITLLALVAPIHADTIELASPNPIDFGQFGISTAGIPDIDGDGFGDCIVGAWEETVGGTTQAGRVYVYSGRTGSLIRSHTSPNAEFDGAYGWSVTGIKDLNNDGRGDYIVGAYAENGSGVTDSGRVYVYNGATGALLRTHTMPLPTSFGRFGYDVDAVPDITGDNRPEYIVGAEGINGSSNGKAYIFNGSTGSLIRTVEPPASADGGFGAAVAGIPDVNGDGIGDYAVGAPYSDPGASPFDAGRAYVFNGVNGALLHELASPNEQSSGQFGISLAGVEDLGGNGLGDLLVGAWLESAGGVGSSGRLYAFSGTIGVVNQTFVSPSPDSSGNFGLSAVGVGDRNGDGFEDVLIGAPGDGGGASASPGRAYVMSGVDGTVLDTLQSPYATSGNREFGYAVGAIPDANGDDLPDFIIGADEDEGASGLPNEGRAYLIRDVPNDACGALFGSLPAISEGFNFFTNIGATGGGTGLTCDGSTFGSDIWFTYESTCNGNVTVSTCSFTNFDTKIAAYEGCGFTQPFFLCDLDTLLACDDDGCGVFAGGSTITFPVSVGECYRVRVGGYNGAQGQGYVLVDCVPTCAGDLNNSGVVDAADLSILLGAWGGSTAGPDINNDGIVDAGDLAILLGNWGPC
jgi:hypothetical protein